MFVNIKFNFETKRVFRKIWDKIPRGWKQRTITKIVMLSLQKKKKNI